MSKLVNDYPRICVILIKLFLFLNIVWFYAYYRYRNSLCSILGKSVNFRVLVTFFHCKSDYYILHALWLLLATSSKGGAANGQVFVAFKPYGNFYSGVQMNWTQHSGAISERYHSGWKQAYHYIKSIYVTMIPIRISVVGMQKWRSTIGMMIS